MNWLATEDINNNYSIRPQYLLPLSDCCILSLVRSFTYCYRIDNYKHEFVELLNKLNILVSDSTISVLPYWITNRILTHILSDISFPTEYFNRLFNYTICSITEITLPQHDPIYLTNRLSQLCTFTLTSLNLCDSIVTDSLLQSIASSKTAVSLAVLFLRNCNNFHQISILECFPNLTHLDISENNLEFGDILPLEVLCLITKYFPYLVSLDLHLTNFPLLFSFNIDITKLEESRNKFFRELSTTPALRELYLYTDIHLDSLNSTHLNLFYSSLYRFTALTHLDLSAWPDLDKLSDSDLSRMSDGLLFLGLYHTPLTQWNCQINIHCKEISGCANGEQIVSTMQCYSKVGPYMDDLYSDLFHHISNKHISLPHDSIKKMAYLVLNSLDKYICKLPKSDCFPLEYKEIIPTLLTWTACLYTLLAELKPHITPNLITRSLTTCIVFLHKINVADILNQGRVLLFLPGTSV